MAPGDCETLALVCFVSLHGAAVLASVNLVDGTSVGSLTCAKALLPELQSLARVKTSPAEDQAMSFRPPPDLVRPEARMLAVNQDVVDAMNLLDYGSLIQDRCDGLNQGHPRLAGCL